jgi:hypothetical protein
MRSALQTLVALGALAMPASAVADVEMCMVIPASGVSFELDVPIAQELPLAPQALVLWCQSSDDPRCSPVRHDDRPQAEWSNGPVQSGGVTFDDVADPSATSVWFVSSEMAPSNGVRHRIERPPRV